MQEGTMRAKPKVEKKGKFFDIYSAFSILYSIFELLFHFSYLSMQFH